jgi:phosphatidylserine/phosphatidylglycerophosphate/cardiolipin synthase-like enzyme
MKSNTLPEVQFDPGSDVRSGKLDGNHQLTLTSPILIDSPLVAQQFLTEVNQGLPELSYKVELDDDGRLQWLATINGKKEIGTKEPLTSWWRRFLSGAYRVLPESQF